MEYSQLVLLPKYYFSVLQMDYIAYGHQGLYYTLSLGPVWFHWDTINSDVMNYVANCSHCQVETAYYNGLHTQQGSLIANNSLDLLCFNFTKINPSRDGKENLLALTDPFTKYRQAFVTNNNRSLP